jgi:hypothetical protein
MTYRQLQDEVIALRFDESKRASVKSWLNIGYQRLWAARDWSFKHTSAFLTLNAGDNSPSMPLDFARAEALYDSQGFELPYLSRPEWEQDFLYAVSGKAAAWTVIDRQIYIGPKLENADTLSLAYKRRLAIVSATSGVIGGTLQADTDQPLWPAEHDYLLVLEAAVLGETLLDGLSSADLMARRDEALQAATSDLAGPQVPGVRVWGAGALSATSDTGRGGRMF